MREFEDTALFDNSQQQHEDMERARKDVSNILDKLDMGERVTTGEMLLLRWWCGIPALVQPKDYAQREMPLDWNG